MITDADLKKIDQMLSRVTEHLDAKIGNLDSKVSNLDSKIDTSSLQLQKEIILLKTEMKKEFKRVHNDQNLIIKHFNEEFLSLQERVDKIEQKVSPQTFS